jgi:hypothetical protein
MYRSDSKAAGSILALALAAGYSSAAIAWSQPLSYGVSVNYQY